MAVEPSGQGSAATPTKSKSRCQNSNMNLAPGGSAAGSFVGLGFNSAVPRKMSVDEQEDGDRDSTGTSLDGSENAEQWGDIDAFSPVATRTYRLYAPSTSSRITSSSDDRRTLQAKQHQPESTSMVATQSGSSAPMSASTSAASYTNMSSPRSLNTSLGPNASACSPVASTSGTSRRNSETWLSIAPSPPGHSGPFSSSLSPPSRSGATLHNRNVSLTSACMPISSSPSKEKRFYRSSPTSSTLSAKQQGKQPASRWDVFSWSSPQAKERSSSSVAMTTRTPRTQRRSSMIQAPLRLALGPLAPYLLAESSERRPVSPDKRISSKPSPRRHTGKSSSLHPVNLLKTLAIAYVCFSLWFFSAHLAGTTFGRDTPGVETRQTAQPSQLRDSLDEYTRWQRAKLRIVGAYNVAADTLNMARFRQQQTAKEAAGDFAGESATPNVQQNQEMLQKLPEIRRNWAGAPSSETPFSPLSPFSHKYRFSKLSSKMDTEQHDQLEPFLFRAQNASKPNDFTACLYYNDAWISMLPDFVERWQGPISVVYEILEPRNSTARGALVKRLATLRAENPLIQAYVDFHAVYTPQSSEFQYSRSRERLLTRPIGTNFQLNLARLFATTEIVWLVSDARLLPSERLHSKLHQSNMMKSLLLDRADAIVVPVFGAYRPKLEGSGMPNLTTIRTELGYTSDAAEVDGVSEEEFQHLGTAYIAAHRDTLPIAMDQWPSRKSALVELASTHSRISDDSEAVEGIKQPIFGLYDRHWDAGKGPTNYHRWRKAHSSGSPDKEESTELDDSSIRQGGFYKVTDYDLHYNPSLLIGRDRQPWCTERFEYNRAVCSYQMYLQGANMGVMPDEWAFTLESIDKGEQVKKNEAEKLKSAISTRLYTKFHSEACMHYGRAFLSMDLWDSDRARHLRYSCSHVFSSYGIGVAEEKPKSVVVEPDQLEQT